MKDKLNKIKYINFLIDQGWPSSEFALVNSAWLTLGGIRENGDLDVIITSKLRHKYFNGEGLEKTIGILGPYEKRVRIHPHNSIYGNFYNCKGMDDLIHNYTVLIDKIKFVELRFFLMYKKERLKKLMLTKNNRTYTKKILGLISSQNRVLRKKINRDINDLNHFDKLLCSRNNFYSDNFTNTSLDYPNMSWKLD